MHNLLSRLRAWLRALRVEIVTAQLIGAKDRAAKLRSLRRPLCPGVVDRLISHAWKISKVEGFAKGLTWVEFAQEVSAFNGREDELAECLTFRGVLLQDLFRASSGAPDRSAERSGLLDEALKCVLEALALRERLADQKSLGEAFGHVSSVYQRLANHLPALFYRLESLARADLQEEGWETEIGCLARLYWELSDSDRSRASDSLLLREDHLKYLVVFASPRVRGDLLEILGDVHRRIHEPHAAFDLWRQAGIEYSASDEPAHAFYVWARAQDLAYHCEAAAEMVEFGERCIRSAPRDVSAESLAGRHHFLAFALSSIGRLEPAIAAYHAAACVSLASEDGSSPGIHLLEAAHLERECGLLEEARADFERVLDGAGGLHTFWDAQFALAELHWRKGDLGTAISWSDRAVEMSLANRMSYSLRASALFLSGKLHFLTGSYEVVVARCDDLLRLFREGCVTPGSVYWYHTNRVCPHCVVMPKLSDVAFMGLSAARIRGGQEVGSRFGGLYLHSLRQEQSESEERGGVDESLPVELRRFSRAESLIRVDPKLAIETLKAALPDLEDQGELAVAAHLSLGLAQFGLGDNVQARASFDRVLELTAQQRSVDEEIVAHYHLGLIEMGADDLEAAFEELSAVILAKEAQRSSLADLDLRQGFSRGTYLAMIEVCKLMGRTREMVETVEKLKSRVLLDLLGMPRHRPIDYRSLRKLEVLAAEREDYCRAALVESHEQYGQRVEGLIEETPEMAEELLTAGLNTKMRLEALEDRLRQGGFLVDLSSQSAVLSFEEIRELCASSAKRVVLVEYLVTTAEVIVLGIRAESEIPDLVAVPIPEERVAKLASSGLAGLEGFSQLLAPVLAWSNEGDLLWLVPHGPLHGVPLHAVKLDGRYLIERNPVCYGPSASILKYCRQSKRGARKTALVLGDPTKNLPSARREAQVVAAMFGTTPLLGGEATKYRLREALGSADTPDILHFAGHSFFWSSQPMESALKLAPGDDSEAPERDGLREAYLTAGEVLALNVNSDLITLSSCESGAQGVGLGDELLGFARAFLFAGAASVLASLWPVEDLSTRLLMEEFYTSLQQGLSKAESLQRAQLHLLRLTEREVAELRRSKMEELMAASGPPFRALFEDSGPDSDPGKSEAPTPSQHPSFWAPFVLVGDWD